MSFASLKKNKSKAFDSLQQKLESEGTRNNFVDDRYWSYKADPSGNAQVTMRFLPLWDGADDTKDEPYVELFSHGFKGVGGWYIDDCRTTIGEDCPVCSAGQELVKKYGDWDKCPQNVQAQLRSGGDNGRGRRKQYIANIYIVNDKGNPDNNGKVFLWKFGPQVLNMVKAAQVPEFDDQVAINPFCLWEGANFKLRVKKEEGQTTYKYSSFDEPEQMLPSDEDMEVVWKTQHNLSELISPDKFKTFEKQQERFDMVMGVKKQRDPVAPVKEEAEPSKKAKTPETPKDEADLPWDTSDSNPVAEAKEQAGSDDDFDYLDSLLDDDD